MSPAGFHRSIILTGTSFPTCGKQPQKTLSRSVKQSCSKIYCSVSLLRGRQQSRLSALSQGGSNGSDKQSGSWSKCNGFDAADGSIEGSSTSGGGDGSFGSNNGGSGGRSGGSGKGVGDDNDKQKSPGPFFAWILLSFVSQVRQPRFLLVLIAVTIVKWEFWRRKLNKESEEADFEEAAAVQYSRVDDSHELAKQLFDQSLDEPWSDLASISSAPAEASSFSQLNQSTPSPLNRLGAWVASPFGRGGDVKQLKETTARLR